MMELGDTWDRVFICRISCADDDRHAAEKYASKKLRRVTIQHLMPAKSCIE
jgi:hypothetical protein